jgi:hypothetical protein
MFEEKIHPGPFLIRQRMARLLRSEFDVEFVFAALNVIFPLLELESVKSGECI